MRSPIHSLPRLGLLEEALAGPPRTRVMPWPAFQWHLPEGPKPAPAWRLPDELIAASIVVALLIVTAALAEAWAVRLERRTASAMAPERVAQRDAGVALARADFSQRGILPVYGSSELERNVPDRASDLFRDAPDGFKVCPIGRAGTTPLLLLEKAAAAGGPRAGGKAVLLVSQFWFLAADSKVSFYYGNFSVLQSMELVFKAPLSADLRRDIARRLLKYPTALARTPLLDAGVRAAADIGSVAGKARYALLRPLGLLETRVMEMQDHFEAVRAVLAARPERAEGAQSPGKPDWGKILAEAEARRVAPQEIDTAAMSPEDLKTVWRNVDNMPACPEWHDLELLMRTFRELHMQLLLLDIPWCAAYYDERGVTAGIRGQYYSMLQSLADEYHVPVVTFQDHEYDPKFLNDHRSHLNPEGWAFIDRDIDAFWHGKLLPCR